MARQRPPTGVSRLRSFAPHGGLVRPPVAPGGCLEPSEHEKGEVGPCGWLVACPPRGGSRTVPSPAITSTPSAGAGGPVTEGDLSPRPGRLAQPSDRARSCGVEAPGGGAPRRRPVPPPCLLRPAPSSIAPAPPPGNQQRRVGCAPTCGAARVLSSSRVHNAAARCAGARAPPLRTPPPSTAQPPACAPVEPRSARAAGKRAAARPAGARAPRAPCCTGTLQPVQAGWGGGGMFGACRAAARLSRGHIPV